MVAALDCQELLERVKLPALTEEPDANPSIPDAGEEGKSNGSETKQDNLTTPPATLD